LSCLLCICNSCLSFYIKRILKELNQVVYNWLKFCTIELKYVANYIIDNYNKINVEIFKNTIVFIEQELLKVKIKNYF